MERHGAPKVAVRMAYNVGSHDEPPDKIGINDIVTSAIILEGTELYTNDEIANKRDEYTRRAKSSLIVLETYLSTKDFTPR